MFGPSDQTSCQSNITRRPQSMQHAVELLTWALPKFLTCEIVGDNKKCVLGHLYLMWFVLQQYITETDLVCLFVCLFVAKVVHVVFLLFFQLLCPGRSNISIYIATIFSVFLQFTLILSYTTLLSNKKIILQLSEMQKFQLLHQEHNKLFKLESNIWHGFPQSLNTWN